MNDPEEHNERGRQLQQSGDEEGAAAAYRSAAAAAPEWSVPWYNLALLFKYRGEWAEALAHGLEAVGRDSSDGAAWWNIGIAATAVEAWGHARTAWRECGVELPEGEGPIEANFGLVPIRLGPRTGGEVVWSERICPARAVVRNVPLPESGFFYGDVLLHDGAPTGSRMRNGQEVPVFDALERLERSAYATFVLDLPASTTEQRSAWSDVAYEYGSWAEDWSESIRFLCRSCSYGLPHEEHDSALASARPNLAVAVAAKSEQDVTTMLERWRERVGYDGYGGFMLAGDDI